MQKKGTDSPRSLSVLSSFLLDAFTRFLQVAALSNTEIVNYTNIAQDCGVSAKTVKEYFAILEETMLGFYLPAYTKVIKRKLIQRTGKSTEPTGNRPSGSS